jgi:hypothetical protein
LEIHTGITIVNTYFNFRSSSRSSSQARNDRNRSPSPSILDLFSRHDGLDDSINEVRNEALDNSSDSTYSPGSIRNVNGGKIQRGHIRAQF